MSVRTPSLPGYEVGLATGNLAPNFEFSTYDGQRLRLADFRGRPVYLNFWATWCDPCKEEMPAIQQILNRYQPDHLAVIAINNGEDAAPAQKFVKKLGLSLTAFAFDPDQDVVKRYRIEGMPTSIFIDAEGLITRVIPGQISLKVMDSSVRDAIIGAGKVEMRP